MLSDLGLWRKTEEGQQAIYQRKDGTRFPVLVFDAPLVTHDGRHIGWMSVVMDVSEQRRIEVQVQVGEHLLGGLYEPIDELIMIVFSICILVPS